jgi:hypothetical protein
VSLLYARHYAREGAGALAKAMQQNVGNYDSSSSRGSSSSSGGGDEGDHLQPPEDNPSYDQLYPINALRNVALGQVTTPLVLQADADLTPSDGLAWGLAGFGCRQVCFVCGFG